LVDGVDECRVEFIYLDGPKPLSIKYDKRLMKQAVDFWKAEGEKMLSYDKSFFSPPEDLSGLAPWYKEFLMDASIYDDEHFKKPWYVS
jgi:hypothetical protein